MNADDTRRAFLTIAGAGAGALLAACRRETRAEPEPAAPPLPSARAGTDAPKTSDIGEDVSATEDLMREHGVFRRILVVYRLSAAHLRAKPASVPLDSLQRAAKLMHTFGEEYHEKQLEEAYLFPAVKKAGGAAADEIDTLLAQHQRGREITDYILAVTQKTLGRGAEPLAQSLEAFALMYEEHAAREDTIVFPAWKKVLSPKQVDEMGELFEEIEHKTFGKDGFDDAVEQIGAIEHSMGLNNAALTAPPPPKP
ncbi:MAG TPA: hemerythrin domain-containing protein [Polyangiaceae bacterium]